MPPRTPSTDGYFTHWVYTLAVQKRKKTVSLVDNLVAITQSTAANATPIVWSAAVSHSAHKSSVLANEQSFLLVAEPKVGSLSQHKHTTAACAWKHMGEAPLCPSSSLLYST